MSLDEARRQKTAQAELSHEGTGEARAVPRSGEASSAANGDGGSGTDHLLDEVVERDNLRKWCPESVVLTSTDRTAGCGPTCPVVWEGCSGVKPAVPYPDSG